MRVVSVLSQFSAIALIFAGALASAQTAEAQWYVSGNLGYGILDDADVTDTVAVGSLTGQVSFDEGVFLSGAVGYTWQALRFEGEISYQNNDLDDLTLDSITLGGTTLSGALGTFDLSGDTSAVGFMVNGWYDFDTGSNWVPSVGMGIGAARINLDIESVAGAATNFDESDTVFAYQVGAGLGYKVTPTTTVGLGYRYFGTADTEFDSGVEKIDGEYNSHKITLGFVSRF